MFSFTDTRITCWDITRTCTALAPADGDPVAAALAPTSWTSGDGSRGGQLSFIPPPSFSHLRDPLKCFTLVDSSQAFVIPGWFQPFFLSFFFVSDALNETPQIWCLFFPTWQMPLLSLSPMSYSENVEPILKFRGFSLVIFSDIFPLLHLNEYAD